MDGSGAAAGRLANSLLQTRDRPTDSVLRGESDNKSQSGKTEEQAGLVGQLRTASVAFEFAVFGSFRATAV
jgi:hypothetical protein